MYSAILLCTQTHCTMHTHEVQRKIPAFSFTDTMVGLTLTQCHQYRRFSSVWREQFSDWIWQEERLKSITEVWGWNSRSLVLCMRKRGFHACWLWGMERSWDQHLPNAESRKGDRQWEDQTNWQEQVKFCYASPGRKLRLQFQLWLAASGGVWAKALRGLFFPFFSSLAKHIIVGLLFIQHASVQ